MQHKTAYIWTFLGKMIPEIIFLLINIILARFLTPSDFGKIGTITVFITTANMLYDSGLGSALIKERNITSYDKSTVWLYNVSISLTLYIALFFIAPHIEHFLNSEGLCNIIRLTGLIIIINSISAVSNALLIKHLRFRYLMISNAISVSIGGIFAVILSINKFGVYSLVAYQLIVSITKTILIVWGSGWIFEFKFSLKSLKKMFSFGIFTTLSNIIDSIYENGLAFIFGKVYSIATAGYFSQAKKLSDASTLAIAQTVGTATFPIISKIENKAEIIKETNSIERCITICLIPLILILSLFSTPIIKIIFGSEWLQSAYYLSILLIGGVFIVLENLNRNFIKGIGEVRKLFTYTILKRLIAVALVLFSAYININFIIYAYILGAAIGYLFNKFLFCIILGINLTESIKNTIVSFLPIIIWYVCSSISINLLSSNLLIQMVICLFFYSLYIVYYFKKYDISYKYIVNYLHYYLHK